MTTAMSASSTALEELLERESRIERVQRNAYYELGLELKAIRDKRLYRVPRDARVNGRYSFETFEGIARAGETESARVPSR